MKIKPIKEINYRYGEEKKIKRLLYRSKEPLLLKIQDFPDKFTLDYFINLAKGTTTYSTFQDDHLISHDTGDFAQILSKIKKNEPIRIFGQLIPRWESAEIEEYVPLWQTLPLRTKSFSQLTKVAYFFGGKGSGTAMHFDREHCCNLHLCLSGKKQVLLFTKDQSDKIYKVPFIGDSLIDFGQPLEQIEIQYPRITQAEGYIVNLKRGDMLFMPRNCWHYTKYLDASSAATYVFYPKKIMHIYGYFTGFFHLGYKEVSGLRINEWPIFKKFDEHYALASGLKKFVLKIIESVLYLFMLPIISIIALISHKKNPRKYN